MVIDINREVFIPLGQAGADAFDDTRSWVDENGRRLSDRLWLAKQHDRKQIDNILLDGIVHGHDPIQVARALEGYLTPLGRSGRTTTPRGGEGNSAARRLARTEMTRAFGQATIQAAELNPFTEALKWNLSASHPKPDECDSNARGSSRGMEPGVYRPRDVPRYPNHPHDKCYLSPVTTDDIDAVVEQLRREAGAGDDLAEARTDVDALRAALDSTGATDLGGRIAPEWTYGGSTGRYTFNEAAALRDYKASWYGQLNQYLRADSYASSRVTAPQSRLSELRDNIDSAFDKAEPLTEPIRVSRGSFVDFIGIEDQKPGAIFVDNGFVSTSVKEEGAGFGRELQMDIIVPKGQKVLAMDPIERGATTGEAEVLLPRGTKFLIREVKAAERRIVVEVVS